MCWQDVKIHRATAGRELRLTTAVTPFQVVGPNPRRTALILLGVSAGTCHVSTDPEMAASTGIHVSTTSAPHRILLSEYGGVVKQGWYGLGSGAGNVLTIIESELPMSEREIDE